MAGIAWFKWGRNAQKKKKTKAGSEPASPAPLEPMDSGTPAWQVANLQGQGGREAQQDAFGLSQLDAQENGLYLILSDGMGGIDDGGQIAQTTVEAVANALRDAAGDFAAVPDAILSLSKEVYRQYGERGGATLVACHIKAGRLCFASVGDSFLYLLRDGALTLLNRRHTWRSELFDRVLAGRLSMRQALEDEQGGALASFIGAEITAVDQTYCPAEMHRGDVLMLCSDGIGDALPMETIASCMALAPQVCCDRLESLISDKAEPDQDNYTAIVAAYT